MRIRIEIQRENETSVLDVDLKDEKKLWTAVQNWHNRVLKELDGE